MLGDNLGELSVSTISALPVHRPPLINSLKQITKKAVLPAIHITRVCETDENENACNVGQTQVAFRSTHHYHHRVSAQSGSTAYSSMRSDSMNVDSALFLPSNHSSMVCIFFYFHYRSILIRIKLKDFFGTTTKCITL